MARHLEIAHDLMEGIDEGRYSPGTALPTEDQLMSNYGTSRNTVRRALRELSSRGRIDTRQGSGSTVREYRPTVHLASSAKGEPDDERYTRYVERIKDEQGVEPTQRLRVIVEAATGKLARLLDLDPSDTAGFVVIRRCDRYIGPRLWQRQLSYYPDFIAKGEGKGAALMQPEDIPRGTRELLAELGYPQTTSWDVVGAKMPSLKDSALFGIGPGTPLLVHDRMAYSGDTPIRFTKTLMPADRHQLLYFEGDMTPESLRKATDVNIYDH
ncbi:GntR family transcriptional regulator [Nocardiopsis gilva YIM 90087]|uniref:GntR family transcriptional regulator n=1 Tax=Nocardiopsis gilva YIM 90087 TaxID=1235441 RepID=A0A223SD58_9ACTN|nr:GntR family transcriptional regulator [Nocardiopsis gilva]ASU86078.1 GntR family transcriptional regulator [Nocardiopsis gilva YIM 90087]